METLQAYPAHLGLIALLALISAFNVQLDMIALLAHLVFNWPLIELQKLVWQDSIVAEEVQKHNASLDSIVQARL